MLTMRYISTLLIALFSLTSITAQTLDDELGFIYVKADYLIETARYEEAIKEFNKIIDKNDTYKDALYKRAYAKYMIAAFKGTKKDLLQSFDVVGITPESISLYGKALESLGQSDAASKTNETASMLNTGGGYSDTSDKRRTDKDDNTRGTETDTDEDKSPSELEKLEDAIGSILDDLLPDRKNGEEEGAEADTDGRTTDTSSSDDGEMDTGDRRRGDSKKPKVNTQEEKEEDKPDTSVREIYIDEDLTLELKNGIGARRIVDAPTILILSETSGIVEVDICVNERGTVTSADYNRGNSTIVTQSLISVAQRKSKEFEFAGSDKSNMCGTIVFKITGSK